MVKSFQYLLFFILLSGAVNSYAQADTDTTTVDTVAEKKAAPKEIAGHQLCIGVDITQPIINTFVSYRKGYEFELDYYLHKELYLVAEGGWGSANVNDTILQYTSKNTFFRIGFNKSFLIRNAAKDWDMAFIGLRYAMSFIQRSGGSYNVYDSIWGNTSGYIPGKNMVGAWLEITGGMRVELLKNFFAGYNIRGKFLVNQGAFQQLAPIYVAGYGKGDKNAVFDFNLYISYAIRWDRKGTTKNPIPTK